MYGCSIGQRQRCVCMDAVWGNVNDVCMDAVWGNVNDVCMDAL